MRIVFDHQVFAFQKYGGISRYFVRLAEGITARSGNSARIIAPLHVNAYLAGLPDGIVRGTAIAASDFNQRIARNISKRIARPLLAAEKPDIVHETYFAAKGSAPRGVPTVLTVYDMIHEIFADSFAATDPTRELKRAAVRRADHILCISESTQRDLLAYIPEASGKTSVTLLGFDSFGARADTSDRPAPRRPYLLYVGERSRYKNFAGLLNAYGASDQLKRNFDIMCFGGGPASASELATIAGLGIAAGAITFLSGSDDALAASYRGASAFIYPSLYEGFGIPPLEAMSSSCPVIASNISSIPEICGEAANYFDPCDAESMRNTIESSVFDSITRADMIKKGHERLKRFSWDQCAQATIESYEALL